MTVPSVPALAIAAAILSWTGCGSSSSGPSPSADPWPTSYGEILTASVTDPPNDLVKAPQDAPPYSTPVSYPAIDVTRVSFGFRGKYLYLRVDFAGVLPKTVVSIPRTGDIEPQTVARQGFNLSVDADNSDATGTFGEGIAGIDIFYALGLYYGDRTIAYANYDFPPPGDPHYGDVHYNRGHLEGEVGEGGPGSSYLIVRFDTSSLGAYVPRGTTVEVGGWSEAESSLYHHFAFDPLVHGTWFIPPN